MKKLKYLYIVLISGVVAWSCEQIPNIADPDPNFTPTPVGGPIGAGNADFTKFIAIGNSLTAGFQAGALFDDGQKYSLPNILSQQFAQVGGGDFIQPDINSVNGYNSTFSNPAEGIFLGRLVLVGSTPTPTPGDPASLPSPLNPAFQYTGDPINNFGVPGILLGQALIPQTGDWSLFQADPRVNPFYARFASSPGTSTIMGDAVAAAGTFFMFWLGNNDVLGYATTGATGAIPLTSVSDFGFQFGAAMTILTTNNDSIQGVVGNIPNVTSIPFFTLVPYNAIPLDQATADFANGAYVSYNGGIQGALQFGLIDQAEADLRTIQFTAGNNAIVTEDEDLTLLVLPDGQGGTITLPNIRQLQAGELVTLPTSAVLGTLANPNDPTSVIGVAVPIEDRMALTNNELTEINTAIDGFNASIEQTIVGLGLSDRIAMADVNKALDDLTNQGPTLVEGLVVTTSLVPPAGLFSEDGVHPNSRGYAFTANVFIDAINAKFNANVPKPDLGNFPATGLPQ